MRILIGGGCGFVGSNLAHECVKRGHEVTIVDNMQEGLGGNKFNVEGLPVKIIFNKIEQTPSWHAIDKDWSDLSAYDIIFNLAANVDYIRGDNNPLYDQYHNATSHLQFLEDCRVSGTQAHIIFTSSRMVYDLNNIYGIHKALGEMYYCYYAQYRGLKTTIARLTNPYGPRSQMKHSHYGILNYFIRLALDDEIIPVYGDGQWLRDYIYIDDVTQALLRLAELNGQGEVYNVGYGIGVKFIKMVQTIIDTVGRGRIEFVKPEYEGYDSVFDVKRTELALHWTPQVDLTEGIQHTVDYYRQYRDHYWTKE